MYNLQGTLFDIEDTPFEGEGKTCSKCNTYLPLDAFGSHSGANFLRAECRKCNNELHKIREHLKNKYGMPEEGYVCPICKGSEADVVGKGGKRNGSWVLDHCHSTESFRGWLCHKCNRSLGGFDDDIDKLKNAIQYLKEHKEQLNDDGS